MRRLDSAGADRRRVYALDGSEDQNGFIPYSLPAIEMLRQTILLTTATLVVIDPVGAYLGGADGNDNAQVRALLAPLQRLAEELQIAIVLVSHLNKSVQGKALYRVTGTVGLVAAVRLAYGVVPGLGPERTKRFVFPMKVNIAAEPPLLGFTFSATATEDDVPVFGLHPPGHDDAHRRGDAGRRSPQAPGQRGRGA